MTAPVLSDDLFNNLFAWSPLVLGLAIYVIFFVAKRKEVTEGPPPVRQHLACAQCGRRSLREHMLPKQRDGAFSWYCPRCAGD